MAEDSAMLRNTRVKLFPIGDASYRTIGLAWRKGSARKEECRLFGKFLQERQRWLMLSVRAVA
jgi:LysR family hydrogen peroxide-inducible transcriptional activator